MSESYFFRLTLKSGEDQRERICNCFEYLCDTHEYLAAFEDGRFQHYANGLLSRHHSDGFLAYDTGNGREIRRVVVRDGELFSGPIEDENPKDKGPIYCRDWSKRVWKVELIKME